MSDKSNNDLWPCIGENRGEFVEADRIAKQIRKEARCVSPQVWEATFVKMTTRNNNIRWECFNALRTAIKSERA